MTQFSRGIFPPIFYGTLGTNEELASAEGVGIVAIKTICSGKQTQTQEQRKKLLLNYTFCMMGLSIGGSRCVLLTQSVKVMLLEKQNYISEP